MTETALDEIATIVDLEAACIFALHGRWPHGQFLDKLTRNVKANEPSLFDDAEAYCKEQDRKEEPKYGSGLTAAAIEEQRFKNLEKTGKAWVVWSQS